MAKRPSRKQLCYLRNLGYAGMPPKTSGEASAAIDAMRATGDAGAAGRAIEDERILAAREQIKAAVVANLGTGPSCLGALLRVSFLAALVVLGGLAIHRAGRDVKPDEPKGPQIKPAAENQQLPRAVDLQPVEKPRQPVAEPPTGAKAPVMSDADERIEREVKAAAAAKKKKVDDEKHAQTQLAAAKGMMAGNPKASQARLRDLIAKYPGTRAAAEAAAMLLK